MSIAEEPMPGVQALSPPQPQAGPITVAMYDRMIAAGVFEPSEAHPLELIAGELRMMSPIGDRHADAVAYLTRWSSQHVDPAETLVWVQNPLTIPGTASVPQPDIAWVTARRYLDRRPRPEEVSLLIEVADTSLDFDTTVKAGLYASAGIADYWIVDLVSRAVIVLRDPRNGRYETRATFRDQAAVSPLARPQASLLPAELMPA